MATKRDRDNNDQPANEVTTPFGRFGWTGKEATQIIRLAVACFCLVGAAGGGWFSFNRIDPAIGKIEKMELMLVEINSRLAKLPDAQALQDDHDAIMRVSAAVALCCGGSDYGAPLATRRPRGTAYPIDTAPAARAVSDGSADSDAGEEAAIEARDTSDAPESAPVGSVAGR